MEKLLYYFTELDTLLAIVLAMGVLVGYYGFFFKKNHYKGVPATLPREQPPRQLSPAALRYIWIHQFDSQCLVAGIMSAVVKDCYRIKWRKASFSIFLNKYGSKERLSEDEQAALSFNETQYLERLGISKKRNRFTRNAEDRMHSFLSEKYGKYLLNVILLVVIGLAFSLLALLAIITFMDPTLPFKIVAPYLLLILPIIGGLSFAIWLAVKRKNYAALAIAIALMVGTLTASFHIESGIDHFIFPALLPLIGINGLFYRLLPRRRPEGARIAIEIEEFRDFLVEKVAVEQSLEKSEYYLVPYMVALDVPFDNNQYFNQLLSEQKGPTSYIPGPFS